MDTNQAKSEQIPKESKQIEKKKRAYHRKPVPPPPPPAPSPAVIALENEVLELVKQRTSANQGIIDAMRRANEANVALSAAREMLNLLDQEVQYRMALIGQMKGQPTGGALAGSRYWDAPPPTPPANDWASATSSPNESFDRVYGVPAGVGSIPATPNRIPGAPRVRSESAEDMRAML